METTYNKPSTAGIALKFGAITALASIIYSIILQVTGLALNQTFSYLGTIILVGGIIMGMKEFKSQNDGYMSYGEGLGLGSLLCAVSGVISSAFSAFYIKFIDDSLIRKSLELQRQEMERKGMEDAQIDQAMAMAEKFTGPGSIFLFGLLAGVIVGFILSLIISAILKKDRVELV